MSDSPNLQPTERREEVKISQQEGALREEHFTQDVASERYQRLFWGQRLVWLLVGTVDSLLGLRLFLKLIASNPDNPFARFIYGLTHLFVGAFIGLTKSPSAEGMILEIPTLVAIVVYALVGLLLDRVIWLVFVRPSSRTVSDYRRERF